MSIGYLRGLIDYLRDRIANETDEDRQVQLHEALLDAEDELRFEYADLEAELERGNE